MSRYALPAMLIFLGACAAQPSNVAAPGAGDDGRTPAGRAKTPPAAAGLGETQVHENASFGFRAHVPADWKLAGTPRGRLAQGQSEAVCFSMPAVWSQQEKQDISNAFTVKAIRLDKPTDADQFLHDYVKSVADVPMHMSTVNGNARPAMRGIVEWKGLRYEEQFEAVVRGDVGYILEFSSTPGTFAINYERFRAAADALEVFAPHE